MHFFNKANRLSYTMKSLGLILNMHPNSLTKKAKRLEWYFITKKQPGSHLCLYFMDALPDEIQKAWASWDMKNYKKAVVREKKKEKGIPDDVPEPTNIDMVRDALSWPIRDTFYKVTTPEGYIKGPKPKMYDGVSRGLSPDARHILLERFPELTDSLRRKHIIPTEPMGNKYKEVSEEQLQETQLSNQYTHLLQKLLDEKDKRIELYELQANSHRDQEQKIKDQEQRIKDQETTIIKQQEQFLDLSDQLKLFYEKYDRLLQSQPSKKRESDPGSKERNTPDDPGSHTKKPSKSTGIPA